MSRRHSTVDDSLAPGIGHRRDGWANGSFDAASATRGQEVFSGRFGTLPDVIEHYDTFLKLRLSEQEKKDLVEYLKSL